VLLCNNGQGTDELTQGLAAHKVPPVNAARAARLFLPAPAKDRASLAALPAYTHALAGVQALA
jgi:hypothetical protein